MHEIGKVVQYHRELSGLSRINLAQLAGVGKTVIYDVEHGKETIRFDSLRKILHVLNIELQLTSPLMKQYRNEEG